MTSQYGAANGGHHAETLVRRPGPVRRDAQRTRHVTRWRCVDTTRSDFHRPGINLQPITPRAFPWRVAPVGVRRRRVWITAPRLGTELIQQLSYAAKAVPARMLRSGEGGLEKCRANRP